MTNAHVHPFTEFEDAKLKKLIGEGKTAREVSAALPGRTRSSVIGRAHRLGVEFPNSPKNRPKKAVPAREQLLSSGGARRIALRPAPRARQPGQYTKVKADPAKVVAPTPVKTHTKIGGRPLHRLTELPRGGCKFPVTRDPSGEWLLCSDPHISDSPYCQAHHEACYVKPTRRVG